MKYGLFTLFYLLLVSRLVAQINTQGITSASHKKYMGKIVMGNTSDAIAFENEQESLFKTDFTYGEEVYLRVYMENSLAGFLKKDLPDLTLNEVVKNGYFNVHFFLDDKEINTYYIKGELDDDHKETWTTFKGALYNGYKGDALIMDGYHGMLTKANDLLTDGKHKVRIDIRAAMNEPVKHETNVVASAEFNLTITAGSISPYDDFMCLPKAKMSNPTLEAKVMKKYASVPENSKNVKEARITSDNWTIVRHDVTGKILYRELFLTVISQNKDGLYVQKGCTIRQDYVGGKFQDNFSYTDGTYETLINKRCVIKK